MKTVKVRVAVAVDPKGYWHAVGWQKADGKPAQKEAMEDVTMATDKGEARYWLEAELPIPEEQTMEVRVETDEDAEKQ